MSKQRNKRQSVWTLDQLLDTVEHYLSTAEGHVEHVLNKQTPNKEYYAQRWLELAKARRASASR